MKLFLQITLGVFFGSLAALLTVDAWHQHREDIAKRATEKLRVEQENAYRKQAEKIRTLLQNRWRNESGANKPPPGFVPDDAQEAPFKQNQTKTSQ